ncbi:hypothetical protein [Clostridium cellulovorans]|uniref:Uncharacterized protein n=1 Tax=Clostridium cellulovorans (strain ATCC 35296 / DSM 3052 / OCM 3 / 743B) TaxID=573061 RepID=D9SVJ4_CLOC7|nr:hypothetical protein [Clostridium cellulovorans]ADL51118.1 hypothetical protein Clocel_1365 [Clostridium cellulovorans 743B]
MDMDKHGCDIQKNLCNEVTKILPVDSRVIKPREEFATVHTIYELKGLCPGREIVVKTVYEVLIAYDHKKVECLKYTEFSRVLVPGKPHDSCQCVTICNDLLVPVGNPCFTKIDVRIKKIDFSYIKECNPC